MRRTGGRRTTLAGQILAVQVLLFAVVLVGVGAVSVSQSRAASADAQERRVRQVAEYVAALPVVRSQVQDVVEGRTATTALTGTAESLRTNADVAVLLVADEGDRVLVSPEDPRLVGEALPTPTQDVPEPGDPSWSGAVDLDGRRLLVARVPVLADDPGSAEHPAGGVVGAVLVGQTTTTWGSELRTALPDLATYLGMAALVGVVGSLLLARRVKGQTLGLEPREIASLVTHREAVLSGIREGVLALDADGAVTVANAAARELLTLPDDVVGRRIDTLGLSEEVVDLLVGPEPPRDHVVVSRGRLLVLNRTAVRRGGTATGTVTSMRDRTALVALQSELGVSRSTTQALRAQTHEFANRLHAISGLVQLGRYEDVVSFVERVSRGHAELAERIGRQVADPPLAALLLATTSLADERDVALVLAPDAHLDVVDEHLSDDLVTVVGNLVDNAVDATASRGGGEVRVDVRDDGAGGAVVDVVDEGPGIDPDDLPRLVRRGETSKDDAVPGGRGVGLALVRLVCQRRGGALTLTRAPGGGAAFRATLPGVPPGTPSGTPAATLPDVPHRGDPRA